MQIVADEEMLRHYLQDCRARSARTSPCWSISTSPASEVEVDAVCDGRDVFVPGIMELVERTGVHSGDSISVYPTFSRQPTRSRRPSSTTPRSWVWASASWACTTSSSSSTTRKMSMSSRSTPAPRARCPSSPRPRAVRWPTSPRSVILGQSLQGAGHLCDLYPPEKRALVCQGAGLLLLQAARAWTPTSRPEMKSTGEAIGYDNKPHPRAVQGAAGLRHERAELRHRLRHHGRRATRRRPCRSMRRFYDLGFNIEATRRHGRLPQGQRHPHARAQARSATAATRSSIPSGSGYVSYVINTRDMPTRAASDSDGAADPPLRGGKQRDHVYRAGHGARAAGRAGGDHAGHFHHRRVR